jgi:hypothetical protein
VEGAVRAARTAADASGAPSTRATRRPPRWLVGRGVAHVRYLGNPMLDAIDGDADVGHAPPFLLLLPGTRGDAAFSLPIMLEACRGLRGGPPAIVAWAGRGDLPRPPGWTVAATGAARGVTDRLPARRRHRGGGGARRLRDPGARRPRRAVHQRHRGRAVRRPRRPGRRLRDPRAPVRSHLRGGPATRPRRRPDAHRGRRLGRRRGRPASLHDPEPAGAGAAGGGEGDGPARRGGRRRRGYAGHLRSRSAPRHPITPEATHEPRRLLDRYAARPRVRRRPTQHRGGARRDGPAHGRRAVADAGGGAAGRPADARRDGRRDRRLRPGHARPRREGARAVDGPLLDTCGTGGTGVSTINVSTTATFVAAADGVRRSPSTATAASPSARARPTSSRPWARLELLPGAAGRGGGHGRHGVPLRSRPPPRDAVRRADPRRPAGADDLQQPRPPDQPGRRHPAADGRLRRAAHGASGAGAEGPGAANAPWSSTATGSTTWRCPARRGSASCTRTVGSRPTR